MNTIPNEPAGPLASDPKHVVDLQVRPGYAFLVTPSQTIILGGGYRQRQLEQTLDDDARQWGDDGREL